MLNTNTDLRKESLMVDYSKRTTLRNVAGIGVGAFAAATSTSALSLLHNPSSDVSSVALSQSDIDLADIQVSHRISAQTNDLEVVLTNVGKVDANITDMTPSQINTTRGRFDFDALFEEGSVELAVGESICVPMQHHPVVLDGSSIRARSESLSGALRQNISIVTDGEALAAVSFANPLTGRA